MAELFRVKDALDSVDPGVRQKVFKEWIRGVKVEFGDGEGDKQKRYPFERGEVEVHTLESINGYGRGGPIQPLLMISFGPDDLQRKAG